MRTNIVLDDKLMQEAQKLSGIKTKRGIIQEALDLFVKIKRQEGLLELCGKVEWSGDLDEMRAGRFVEEAGRKPGCLTSSGAS